MTKTRNLFLLSLLVSGASIIGVYLGAIAQHLGVIQMKEPVAVRLKEPLLLQGDGQEYYSLLPAGTALYHYKGWAEGHQTWIVYLNFKGSFEYEKLPDPNVLAPLWLYNVEKADLPKLLEDYPLTKDELVTILKARKVSRDDLADIIRNWKD